MGIDAFTVRLIYILIPGAIVFGVVSTLAAQRNRDKLVITFQIVLYGLSTFLLAYVAEYTLAFALRKLCIADGWNVIAPAVFTDRIFNSESPFPFGEVVVATAIAPLLGIAIAVNLNRSILIKICRWLGLSNRHSDVDVWSYTLNSDDIEPWVTIRHPERNVIYDGYVEAYSAGKQLRELLISRVNIYDLSTGEHVDSIPVIYLTLNQLEVVLEFRVVELVENTPSTEGPARTRLNDGSELIESANGQQQVRQQNSTL